MHFPGFFAPLLFKFLRLPKFLSSSFKNLNMMQARCKHSTAPEARDVTLALFGVYINRRGWSLEGRSQLQSYHQRLALRVQPLRSRGRSTLVLLISSILFKQEQGFTSIERARTWVNIVSLASCYHLSQPQIIVCKQLYLHPGIIFKFLKLELRNSGSLKNLNKRGAKNPGKCIQCFQNGLK